MNKIYLPLFLFAASLNAMEADKSIDNSHKIDAAKMVELPSEVVALRLLLHKKYLEHKRTEEAQNRATAVAAAQPTAMDTSAISAPPAATHATIKHATQAKKDLIQDDALFFAALDADAESSSSDQEDETYSFEDMYAMDEADRKDRN